MRLFLRLRTHEWTALRALALKDGRSPKEIALYLIRLALQQAGYLQSDPIEELQLIDSVKDAAHAR